MALRLGAVLASSGVMAVRLRGVLNFDSPEVACQAESGQTSALRRLGCGLVIRFGFGFLEQDGEEQLLLCLSMYLQCVPVSELVPSLALAGFEGVADEARLFLKGKRHQRHLVANELAALICLQLKAI